MLLEHVWNANSKKRKKEKKKKRKKEKKKKRKKEKNLFRALVLPLLRGEVSRSGGDLLDTGKVTKSVGNGV